VIPTIGVMIGMYILTRMVEMVLYTDRKGGTKALGWITVVVAVVGMISLVTTGQQNWPSTPRAALSPAVSSPPVESIPASPQPQPADVQCPGGTIWNGYGCITGNAVDVVQCPGGTFWNGFGCTIR
jgi:hypothetical protein